MTEIGSVHPPGFGVGGDGAAGHGQPCECRRRSCSKAHRKEGRGVSTVFGDALDQVLGGGAVF